jgi:uncharacterized damage-inducible protein DinB
MIEILLDGWNETRALTYDLIKEIPLEKLNEKIDRPGLNSLAKQIYELALVQKAYIKVLDGKPLDFSDVEKITFGSDDYAIKSKEELVKLLEEEDVHFHDIINRANDWDKEIKIFGKMVPTYAVLELMTKHETLHHGQLIIFCYTLGIKFPASWVDTWALPQKWA